jgi:hypothetical protein
VLFDPEEPSKSRVMLAGLGLPAARMIIRPALVVEELSATHLPFQLAPLTMQTLQMPEVTSSPSPLG